MQFERVARRSRERDRAKEMRVSAIGVRGTYWSGFEECDPRFPECRSIRNLAKSRLQKLSLVIIGNITHICQ
jgi:hypothetical protein